jgi:hypothetical protein
MLRFFFLNSIFSIRFPSLLTTGTGFSSPTPLATTSRMCCKKLVIYSSLYLLKIVARFEELAIAKTKFFRRFYFKRQQHSKNILFPHPPNA